MLSVRSCISLAEELLGSRGPFDAKRMDQRHRMRDDERRHQSEDHRGPHVGGFWSGEIYRTTLSFVSKPIVVTRASGVALSEIGKNTNHLADLLRGSSVEREV